MSAGHPSDDTLFEYALDELDHHARAEVDRHLPDCAACRQIVAEYRELEAATRDPETWEVIHEASLPTPDPGRVREFAARIARKDREDQAAGAAIADLREVSLNQWRSWLRVRIELHTAGMVTALLAEARARVRHAPRQSLQIVTIATDIAETLADRLDRLTMLGLAANERATVLRFLGMLPQALLSVDNAAAVLRELDTVPDEKARVAWNRASVLFAMQRYRDARAALKEPKEWFRSIGDDTELARIGILEGSILHDEGDRAGALAVFADVARVLERQPEQPELAMVYANIAFCHVALGDLEAARSYGSRAMETYDRIEMLDERIRTQWMFAQVLIESGNIDEGLRDLQAAASAYEGAGMVAAAAHVDLERVEILLRIDAWAAAAAIARRLVTVYERTEQRISYVHALAYLREAVDATSATPGLARYIREYVANEVEQPFDPPATPLPS